MAIRVSGRVVVLHEGRLCRVIVQLDLTCVNCFPLLSHGLDRAMVVVRLRLIAYGEDKMLRNKKMEASFFNAIVRKYEAADTMTDMVALRQSTSWPCGEVVCTPAPLTARYRHASCRRH